MHKEVILSLYHVGIPVYTGTSALMNCGATRRFEACSNA